MVHSQWLDYSFIDHWQVFIRHAKTQHNFDPPTEAVVWHSLHCQSKPRGAWDICQILLDQRMTITPTSIHIPPTAASESSWPLSSGQVKKHRCFRAHAHDTSVCSSSICLTNSMGKWVIQEVIKYSKSAGCCCCLASVYSFLLFFHNKGENELEQQVIWCCLTYLCIPRNSHVHPLPIHPQNKRSTKM